MNVFVTGIGGFIGRNVVRLWSKDPFITLQGVSQKPVEFFDCSIGDVGNTDVMAGILEEARSDVVVHLASNRNRIRDPSGLLVAANDNIATTMGLFLACAKVPTIRRIIVMGTAEEYGNQLAPFHEDQREAPVSAYSYSKVCIAHLGQIFSEQTGISIIHLRPTVCYGYHQAPDMFLSSLLHSLLNGNEFAMTNGTQKRDFLFVDDMVSAIRAALTAPIKGFEIINIGSGISEPIVQVARRVASSMGLNNLLNIGALPERPLEIIDYVVSIAKAKMVLGWVPEVSLADGLDMTIRHLWSR